MATLRSLYSAAVVASVPFDTIGPASPSLMMVFGSQGTNGGLVPLGCMATELNWTAPTRNWEWGEFLGAATGGADVFETQFDPVEAGERVYEVEGPFGGSGRGDTLLTSPAANGDDRITVASTGNFAMNDFLRVHDLSGGAKEYAEVAQVIGPTVLRLKGQLVNSFPAGAEVKEPASHVLKTGGGAHYTLNAATGQVTLAIGQFVPGAEVAIFYETTLQDLAGFALIRIKVGSLLTDLRYSNVSTQPGAIVVSGAISPLATAFTDTLDDDENGETWAYYLFALDNEGVPNYSLADAVLVETITSIPQDVARAVGDQAVVLTWDAAPGSSDENQDGWNVYRSEGAELAPSGLRRLNASMIPKGTTMFRDSQGGIDSGERVSSGTVPLPLNGATYTYVLESEDTSTEWTVGTNNERFGVPANLTASKSA